MKVYHLLVRQLEDKENKLEVSASADGEEEFSAFELVGILELVKADILASIRGGSRPPTVLPLILPSRN